MRESCVQLCANYCTAHSVRTSISKIGGVGAPRASVSESVMEIEKGKYGKHIKRVKFKIDFCRTPGPRYSVAPVTVPLLPARVVYPYIYYQFSRTTTKANE